MNRLTYAICALALLFQPLAAWAGLLSAGRAESFVFTDDGSFSDRPLTVFYYKSKRATADAKLIFSIHGVERSGKRARDNWIDFAEKQGAIVLAPEFDEQRFPTRLFQMGGIEQPDRSKWTFTLIEKIFDKVRSEEHLSTPAYMLFGHSAGAQFVHRFVLMTDRPRLSIAIAANAGSYTLPAYPASPLDFKFPWMLDRRVVDDAGFKDIFGRKMIILLGEQDIQTDGGHLPKSREALAQGANRLERGKNFHALAKSQAAQAGIDLQWKLVTVPGVGHNSREMSKAAARILLEQAI